MVRQSEESVAGWFVRGLCTMHLDHVGENEEGQDVHSATVGALRRVVWKTLAMPRMCSLF